jgi:hypothetical protein
MGSVRRAEQLGRRTDQAGGHLGAGGRRQRRQVDLEHERDAAVGETGDEVQLPQRAGAVEGTGVDAGHHLVERLGVVGLGHGDVAEVVVEVEVGMVTPPGPVQPERHLRQGLAQHRQVVEAGLDLLAQQPTVDRCSAWEASRMTTVEVWPERGGGLDGQEPDSRR